MKRKVSVVDLGTVLGVWAHPDDETWLAGGIMSQAVDNDQRVISIVATRGEKGTNSDAGASVADLGVIRTSEIQKALDALGGGNIDLRWLSYKDGRCASVDLHEASTEIRKVVLKELPDTILTFGPDGYTGHSDHAAVSAWVDQALEGLANKPRVYHAVTSKNWYEAGGEDIAKRFDVYFKTDSPCMCEESDMDLCIKLDDKALTSKLDALRAHHSQTTKLFEQASETELRAMFSRECFLKAPHNIPQ